jgi:fatty acid desaturase
VAVALFILGGRHLGLSILMHEASHRSLFANRRVNDFIGKWLCAAPTGGDLAKYRVHHMAHHAHTGTERDTDIGLVRPFPITKRSLIRKLARDLAGITGLKRLIGLLLINFGYVEYTASVDPTPIDQTGRSFVDVVLTGVRNSFAPLLTNTILFGALWAVGHPWLYTLWVTSYLTTFSLFVRIRAMAEHACTGDTDDPFGNTRTTHANVLARLSVAPHRVNYHLEHHLLMTVPYFQLPALHRVLRERGALENAPVAANYRDVLRLVVIPQSA